MNKFYRIILSAAAICLLLPKTCLSQISIASAIVAFNAGDRPFLDVGVNNSSNKAIYAVSEMVRLKNPSEDTDDVESTEDILVSPKRVSIPPKSSRNVRLLLKKGYPDEERVYRLIFKPENRQEDDNENAENPSHARTVLKVVTTVGMLAFVEPKLPKVDFTWTFEGSKVIFKNNGNVHMRVFAPRFCPDEQKGKGSEIETDKCKKIDSFRIYPGKMRELEIEAGHFLRFEKRRGEEMDPEIIELSIPNH